VERTAEDLGELATEMVIGEPTPAPAPATVSIDEPGWTEIDPLAMHLAALSDQLQGVASSTIGEIPAEHVRQIASEARRHLNRIEELANDGSFETIGVAQHIQGVRRMLDALSQLILMAGEPPVSIAQAAIEIAGGLREELRQGAAPGYGRPMRT
jgi:replicative DNA helicase